MISKRMTKVSMAVLSFMVVFAGCGKKDQNSDEAYQYSAAAQNDIGTDGVSSADAGGNINIPSEDSLVVESCPEHVTITLGEGLAKMDIDADVYLPDRICTGTALKYSIIDEFDKYLADNGFKVTDGKMTSGENDNGQSVSGNQIIEKEGDRYSYEAIVVDGNIWIDNITDKDYVANLSDSTYLEYSEYSVEEKKQTDEYERVLNDTFRKYDIEMIITDHNYEKTKDAFVNTISFQAALFGGAVISGVESEKINDNSIEFINGGIYGAHFKTFYRTESEEDVNVYSVEKLLEAVKKDLDAGDYKSLLPIRGKVKYIRLGYIVDENNNFRPVWMLGIGFPTDNEYIIAIYDAQTLDKIGPVRWEDKLDD